MTNIAMENPNHKWRFLAGKIIYKWVIFSMAMLVITREGNHRKQWISPRIVSTDRN